MYKEERKGKWKSSIKRKTLVPIYNEQFQFDLTDMEMKFVRLDIYVMDYDMLSRNDVMGVLQLGEDIPAMSSPSGKDENRTKISFVFYKGLRCCLLYEEIRDLKRILQRVCTVYNEDDALWTQDSM